MTTPLHVACYGDLRAWFRRRRRAILLTAGAVGAGCLLYYGYTRYSSSSAPESASRRVRAEEEARDAQEQAQQRVQRHFDGIQVLADTTTLPPVLARFKDHLFKLIDIQEITRQLLAGKQTPQALPPAEKLQLWQKVKILSFTRAVSAALGIGLAHLFIRMQLNLLGRRVFISTARDLSDGSPSSPSEEFSISTQQGFLALNGYFPDHGYRLLAQDAEEAVTQVLGDVSLKQNFAFDELRNLFIKINTVFEEQRKDWSHYLLPQDGKQSPTAEDSPTSSSAAASNPSEFFDDDTDEKQEELVAELRGVLSSPEFNDALGAVLETLLEFMMQEFVQQYQNQPETGLAVARLVPSVSSRGTLLERAEFHKYVDAIAELPQVKSLSALVYGSPNAELF